ncbi:hypothetical protein LTS15_002432 [Exophiala xenobiotica]|nr:hypothetical protein LTS15_002432 [Exophiala xenobiotica]
MGSIIQPTKYGTPVLRPGGTCMPTGSKLWLLNLGELDADAAGFLSGANTFKHGLPPQEHERRRLIMISVLVSYPGVGLILFDVGSSEDIIENWDRTYTECTPRIWDKAVHGLPEAIKGTGAGEIGDVKIVVLSHLHLDHAGGLEHFFDTGVEIWCHEAELKNAFWTCATAIDSILYRPNYLCVDRFNWKTFSRDSFTLLPGIRLHRCPGHTEGLIVAELEMEQQGTIVLTGDLFHVKENFEDGRPQGRLMRDYNEWFRSRDFVINLATRKNAKVLLGHDPTYFGAFKKSPEFVE